MFARSAKTLITLVNLCIFFRGQQNWSIVAIFVPIVFLATIILLVVGIMFRDKVWKKASSCIQHQREGNSFGSFQFKMCC